MENHGAGPPFPPAGQQDGAAAGQQGGGGSAGGGAAGNGLYPSSTYVQQLYAQQQLGEELRKFWDQAQQEVDEHSEALADFKTQALPLARIKKIMKSDEDVRMISAEAPVLFARACEFFIQELTVRSWSAASEFKRRTMQRSDVATAIARTDIFDFLVDIVPREEGNDPLPGEAGGAAMPAAAGVQQAQQQAQQAQQQQAQQQQQQQQQQQYLPQGPAAGGQQQYMGPPPGQQPFAAGGAGGGQQPGGGMHPPAMMPAFTPYGMAMPYSGFPPMGPQPGAPQLAQYQQQGGGQ